MRQRAKSALEPLIVWLISLLAALQVRLALAFRPAAVVDRRGVPNVNSVRRILIVRLDEIGDLVMTTPLLRELRRALPGAHITVVVKKGLEGLVSRCPYIDEVIGFACAVPHWKRALVLPGRALRLGRKLRASRFELALLPRREFDLCYAALIALFSNAPVRVAFTESIPGIKPMLNRGYDLLFTHVVSPGDRVRHEVEHNLEMLRHLGISAVQNHTELWTDAADEEFASETLAKAGLKPPLIALCASPGNSILKQWPPERFAGLARQLAPLNASFVAIGGPREESLGQQAIHGLGSAALNLCGRTTLTQMAAVLRACDLLISNDTGPMHVAAAVGTPVVALFGSSCPHLYRAWGNDHRVVSLELACSPCRTGHKLDRCRTCIYGTPRCMTDITILQVAKAAIDILQRGRASSNTGLLGNFQGAEGSIGCGEWND